MGGEVVRTATGPNDRPGGSERLARHTWDVRDLSSKTAILRIVDDRTGGWGHISIDSIFQSEERVSVQAKRNMTLQKRYLNFPVKNGAPMQRVRLLIGDQTVREFDIELAPGKPDFWVFLDISAFAGQQAILHIESFPRDSKGPAAIIQTDEIEGAQNLYKEKYRPQFHFTSRRGWNNDPNGLVQYKGEYHLFYQHNPYDTKWGNMHWGHAVSEDLVRWRELPIALYPKAFGDWCFSGSAVVDGGNTAGFKTGDEDAIVAVYTSTGRGEAIAYSNDRGRTFTDYEGNPVVEHQGRDPKVIWHEPTGRWVMAVYDELPVQGADDPGRYIAFYTSRDLKDWQFTSRIEGYYECPEIFELPVDGDPQDPRWVVYAADGAYTIGRFDGEVFTPESGKHRYNMGNCFYASQTFSNIPPEDGRRIQIAWGQAQMPGMPFSQMMNFPVELSLRTTDEGIRLFAYPIREITGIRAQSHRWTDLTLAEDDNPLCGVSGELLDINVEFSPVDAEQFSFYVRGIPVTYDAGHQQVSCQGCVAALRPDAGKVRLRLLLDGTSIEIFGNDGRVYMPVRVVPSDDIKAIDVFSRGGRTRVHVLEVHELRSAWE